MKKRNDLIPHMLEDILLRAAELSAPTRNELIYLLSFPETSLEAGFIRAAADAASRARFNNEAILLGQIGIETSPCPANCRFCVFGRDHSTFPESKLDISDIIERANAFTCDGDLYGLFLMTMHLFDFDRLLNVVSKVRDVIPSHTRIVVNVGDFDAIQAKELKAAGVSGAYHILRLKEGIDTDLKPDERKATIRSIREAGMDLYYCCEPVGPEHTPEELVDQIMVGIENCCFQHAAMRRVALPGLPLAERGQINELRLGQIVAVVTLASLGCSETTNIAVHEPNLIGLTAGANAVYAETGANPRDTEADTTGHRGFDMASARKMLYESGFQRLRRGDGSSIPLTLDPNHQ
ncbi:MAG: hypothetical protein ABIH86_04895 [Planctomycetota bacterium]